MEPNISSSSDRHDGHKLWFVGVDGTLGKTSVGVSATLEHVTSQAGASPLVELF